MKLKTFSLLTTLTTPLAFANDAGQLDQQSAAITLTSETSAAIDSNNNTPSFPESFKPQGEAVLGLQSLESQEIAIQEEHWSGLPFLGKKAREMGYQLPIPLGFNVFYNKQEVGYTAQDAFKLGLKGQIIKPAKLPKLPDKVINIDKNIEIPADLISITGEDESVQLKVDAWILPFWNIYGLLGYTKGNKDIAMDLSSIGISQPLVLPIEYEAYNVGIGQVLAGQVEVIPGMHPFIFTAVTAFTNSWTTTTDSTIQTYIGSFRAGQRYAVPGGQLAVLLGYNYQLINQNITGSYSFDLPDGYLDVDYDVALKSQETSNMSVSMVYDFGPKQEWNMFLEYGFLNWNQVIFSIGRRF
ncbi:hypothetical protein FR932_08980 [Moritella marina ATCC 15381]|uniref:Transporter n=1 Tax=Moritella marina ATCC 15381 TaxID=1202962 RepID=A0A5J6WKL4_MORMI|nr:hypothetical protein [Moritella marina]QFI37974.1 hypothetical protein FR932_08980 [Moritella marina ATCC 15381]